MTILVNFCRKNFRTFATGEEKCEVYRTIKKKFGGWNQAMVFWRQVPQSTVFPSQAEAGGRSGDATLPEQEPRVIGAKEGSLLEEEITPDDNDDPGNMTVRYA
jgi:hypothetical protein